MWAQSIKRAQSNLSWNFQNTFFVEHISVAVSWNYILVSTLPYRGSPRLWNTFESAYITLDAKIVVKINYEVPIHSATELKKHIVQNWVNKYIFLNNILDSQ